MRKNLKVFGGLATLALLGLTSNVYAKDCTELQAKINQAAEGSVVQAEACDGALTFGEGKNVIFDLNGNTINATNVMVKGNVTIKDSVGNGKINGTPASGKAAVEVIGDLTLESGNIESNGHGVMANGGNVTVKGGSITAQYEALGGNNTLGTMVFNVEGGTLTSKEGPSVYMPGPISYTMTGGTLNGGLLFRMGIIKISGGDINGQTNIAKLDDLKQYYSWNGYVNYPDALGVVGGTYTSKDPNHTNKLDIEITGGNFTSTAGSAVAIYDLGKIAQDMKVNISNGKFITNNQDRNAYDVLTLDDIGVTNPKSGYNNAELIGKVKTTITGGYYNTDVTEYVEEGYVQNNNVVSKVEEPVESTDEPQESTDEPVEEVNKDMVVSAPTIDTKEEVEKLTVGLDNAEDAKKVFAKALETLNIDDNNIQINVKTQNLEEKDINEDVVKNMMDALKKSQPNAKASGFFDISLNILDLSANVELGEIAKLDSKIKFNVALPKELKEVEEGYTRTYFIIRYHDGVSEVLDANLNEDKSSISFESDKFSYFLAAYKDTKDEEVVPKTFDSISSYLVVGAVAILSIVGLTTYLKKQRKN